MDKRLETIESIPIGKTMAKEMAKEIEAAWGRHGRQAAAEVMALSVLGGRNVADVFDALEEALPLLHCREPVAYAAAYATSSNGQIADEYVKRYRDE